ncbi:hypothetical protein AOG23_22105 [Rhizobium acidisoli]|nr:hypothetical protein AOG23_22105 [Rhizobium acidisoli]
MANEGIVGALRQRLERGKHIAQGLGGDKLVEHGGDGSGNLLHLVNRPTVVHLLSMAAAFVECEIIDHPKGVTDRATNTIGFDPVSFNNTILKDILGI